MPPEMRDDVAAVREQVMADQKVLSSELLGVPS
jgi:hypothetical protein